MGIKGSRPTLSAARGPSNEPPRTRARFREFDGRTEQFTGARWRTGDGLAAFEVREDAISRINTNIPAIRAIGRLGVNQNDLVTRLERLSTGLRINRGKDDPSGLIASETLRSEIRGISQAIDNSMRAINVLSTAEGALNEVSALLLDLRALVTETANTGALSEVEIEANQLEVDSILASIDRIANTTQFAGEKLVNGNLGYSMSGVDTAALASVQMFSTRIPEGGSRNVVVEVTNSAETAVLNFTGTSTSATSIEIAGLKGTDIISFVSGETTANIATAINNLTDATGVSAMVSGSTLVLASQEFGSDAFVSVKAVTGNFMNTVNAGTTSTDSGVDVAVLVNGQTASTKGLRVDIRTATIDGRFYLTSALGQALSSTSFDVIGGGAVFQIGPQVTPQAQINIGITSVSTGNLGNPIVGFLDSIRSGGTNQMSSGSLAAAEAVLDEAVNQVATLRGRLGSVQKNQLETNINSQQVALENVQASESIIRDADIAVEVAALTRAQILVQSTQATLGIAIQMPLSVLSLLG